MGKKVWEVFTNFEFFFKKNQFFGAQKISAQWENISITSMEVDFWGEKQWL
jgi:hypothetical protein